MFGYEFESGDTKLARITQARGQIAVHYDGS
jgi:hypothetical protein